MKLFEKETILSVEARGEINWGAIETNSKELSNFENFAFNTEGIKAVASKELKKASVDPKYLIKKLY